MSSTVQPPAGSLKRLTALITADALSRFGSVMTVTAIPWFVLVTTGSVTRTGLTVFVEAIGVVIALLFGGVIVDQLPLGRASPLGDLLAGLAIGLVPALFLSVGLAFWQLLVLVFVGTLFSIPAQVARYSALPDLAETAGVRFERANAIFDGSLTVASLVGPAAAGILIAWIGASNVLWVDAATFGLSAIIVTTLLSAVRRPVGQTDEPGRYLEQLRTGIRFVVRDPVLGPLVIFLAVTNLAIGPIESVFIPVVAQDLYHSAYALGWLASAMAFGALGGNAVYGLIGHRLSRRGVFAAGFLVVPVAFAVLATKPSLTVAIGFLAMVGLGLSLLNLLEYTIYFERLPADMRARGLGTTGALSWATVPVGRIMAGVAVAAIGLTAALGTFAILSVPVSIAVLGVSLFRVLDRRTAPAPQS